MKHLALFFHGCSLFFLWLSVRCDKEVVQEKILARLAKNMGEVAMNNIDQRVLGLTHGKRND